jgi:hypothetical protein
VNAKLERRIRIVTGFFIAGLIISGASAIPLVAEVDCLVRQSGVRELAQADPPSVWGLWLTKVQAALHSVTEHNAFLFYGTDWLAFGHFAIAIAFIGALLDPIRNRWLFTFGMIACASVVPYAFVFGALRGIPVWWRLIDCSFGVLGFVPLWFCHRWSKQFEVQRNQVC